MIWLARCSWAQLLVRGALTGLAGAAVFVWLLAVLP